MSSLARRLLGHWLILGYRELQLWQSVRYNLIWWFEILTPWDWPLKKRSVWTKEGT